MVQMNVLAFNIAEIVERFQRTPTVGIFPLCCACANKGQAAAAPPRKLMKVRRLIDHLVGPRDQTCRQL